MCKVVQAHPSGCYAWKSEPRSARTKDDQRLSGLLKQGWQESGGVYGYRKLTLNMRDLGYFSCPSTPVDGLHYLYIGTKGGSVQDATVFTL